jgi:hypothetical protein
MQAVTPPPTAQQVTQHRTVPALRIPKLRPQPTASARPSLSSTNTLKTAPQQTTHHISLPALQPTLNTEVPLLAMVQAHMDRAALQLGATVQEVTTALRLLIPELPTALVPAFAVTALLVLATNAVISTPLTNDMDDGLLKSRLIVSVDRVIDGAGTRSMRMMMDMDMGSHRLQMIMGIFTTTVRLQFLLQNR